MLYFIFYTNDQYLISCYVYDNGTFKTNVTMPKGFKLSAGIVLNDDNLWITGGEGQPYSSVEVIICPLFT